MCEGEGGGESESENEDEREAETTRTRDGSEAPAYEASRAVGVLRVRRTGTEWLSTGWNGGRSRAPTAYNVSVPEGWTCDREELGSYVANRLEAAGFVGDGDGGENANGNASGNQNENGNGAEIDGGDEDPVEHGPVLLTGVDLEHARGARCGPVTAHATAGISNPAALPMEPPGGELPDGRFQSEGNGSGADGESESSPIGTVNVIVATTRALADGALANLLTVAAEAKAATLLSETGFPGTTTDAVVVGHDPAGPSTAFSGSATAVGAATRACVRESIRASLRSRYATDAAIPDAVADATYGVSTDVRATVFRPTVSDGTADDDHRT